MTSASSALVPARASSNGRTEAAPQQPPHEPNGAPAPLYDRRQLAELLNVSVATVDRRVRLGLPPRPIFIGRLVRFPADAVAAMLRASDSDGA